MEINKAKAEGGEDLYVAGIDEAGRSVWAAWCSIAWCKRSFEKNLKSRGLRTPIAHS